MDHPATLRHLLSRSTVVAAWIAAGAAVPWVFGSQPQQVSEFDFIVALVMVGVGLNIVLGFAGLIFLGPSALFAAGAFGAGILAVRYVTFQSLPMMCLVSVAVACILAVIVATVTLRVGGFYLGMVTLFLALVVPLVAMNWSLTGASNGLSLLAVLSFIQRPSGVGLYEVGVGIVVLLAGYSWLIKYSRLGRRFGTIMASEDLAQSVGVTPYSTKVMAFMLSAVPCGIAGGFYVYSQQFISPSSITVQESIYILAGVVIGGSGTIIGPILGVALIGAATQFLGGFNEYEGLVYGAALIIVAILMPSGVVGLYQKAKQRLQGVRGPASSAKPVPHRVDRPLLGNVGTTGASMTVSNVSRSFGGVKALDAVNLVLERGKIHALVGPNGSGKTTLLNLITGYYSLDSGSVHVGEERLDQLSNAAAIARRGIVRTFQTPKLLMRDSCQRNVLIAVDRVAEGTVVGSVLHTRRARRAQRLAEDRANELLDTVGLLDRQHDAAGLVPHGTQRLLEIARALALNPTFILLDEPAAGLSGAEAETLKGSVRAMASLGLGVLIVEHNLPVVFDIADTVTVLHQGQVIASGTPDEVTANSEVVRVYIGRQRLEDRSNARSQGAGTQTP